YFVGFGKHPTTRRFPMNRKFIVRLSNEERAVCQEVVKKLKGSSQKVRGAQILLNADADGPGWTDAKIAERFNCHVQADHVTVAGVCTQTPANRRTRSPRWEAVLAKSNAGA